MSPLIPLAIIQKVIPNNMSPMGLLNVKSKVTRMLIETGSVWINVRLFNITLPRDNVPGLTAGTMESVSDGYWILLNPYHWVITVITKFTSPGR